MTNLGGILSTWIFTHPPRYTIATRINLAFSVGIVIAALVNILYLRNQNAKKIALLSTSQAPGRVIDAEKSVNGTRHDGYDERKRLGDRHPRFLYTL